MSSRRVSSRSLREASTAARARGKRCRSQPSATRTDPSRAACTSAKNALTPIAATRLVHVTHPFHPLSGRQLLCVGERYNRYGTTLLLETGEGTVCAVRPQWTDVVAPDPEIILGGQKAMFRVADLLELAHLVDRLNGRDRSER